MSKTEVANHAGDLQPDELGALKELVVEFMTKLESIDNEIELLKTDRKELFEEYSDKLDLRSLKAALRIVDIKNGVAHKDTFDCFLEVLESHEV
jgi:hypothetical protein